MLNPGTTCLLVPAYNAQSTVEEVVVGLRSHLPDFPHVWVVDDGSQDRTREAAERAGAFVLSHPENRGKGAAIRTGLLYASKRGLASLLTVDADLQHPPEAVRTLATLSPAGALVLGVRDLGRAGAPGLRRFSNGVSNFFLSRFLNRTLSDTQCGLRTYPVAETLRLGVLGTRYEFEAEVIVRAVKKGLPVVEIPISVNYPEARVSHFRNGADTLRIIGRVLYALSTFEGSR